MGRSILVATGWVATAAIATVIGLGAIRLVGESLTGTPGGVRSEAEIERALAAPEPAPTTSTTSAAPGTTGTAPSASSGVRRGFATDGGTAVAECGVGGVRLVSWAPAQGYRVRDVDRGPDDDVEVTFQGATREYELKVRCIGSEPVAVADD
ncbi:Non-specific serine/threonine protein kinase [Micromonospora noduli]|uniref:septum formation initiator n=1 Tax=Micromonospora noduli TaxID=709876 RepID=UPI000DC02966|nr:septum formation initiator [Micromonospora noduli]RAO31090.1 Non-specific serine/threonine protein kinase [Micromonospora noduli]